MSETDRTRTASDAVRGSKKQKAGNRIVSTGRRAPAAPRAPTYRAITNRLLWRVAAARHDRITTAPRHMFRAVAETLAFNPDPGLVASASIGSALKAITGASRIAAAAERAGIMCDFGNRMAAAKATADPRQLAGILRTIKEQRAATLATAARNAKRESSEKRQAVLSGGQAQRPGHSSRRKPRRPSSTGRSPVRCRSVGDLS